MKLPLVGAVLGVVAVIVIAGAFLMNRQNVPLTTNNSSENSVILDETVEQAQAPQSLRDLMDLSANQMCTFSDEAGNSGTVYIGGGKMRGDFVSTMNDQAPGTHMVLNNSNIYTWFDGGEEGFKVSLAEIEKLSNFGEDDQKSVNLDEPKNFDCSPWTVDNSMFNLPDIEFRDLGSLTAPGTTENGATGDMKAIQCGACNSLPAENQEQCRQILGC